MRNGKNRSRRVPRLAAPDVKSARTHLLDWADRHWFDLAPVVLGLREGRLDPGALPRLLSFAAPDADDLYTVKLLLRDTPAENCEQVNLAQTRKAVVYLRQQSAQVEARRKQIHSIDRQVNRRENLIKKFEAAVDDFELSEREGFISELTQERDDLDRKRISKRSLLSECERLLADNRAQFVRSEFYRLCRSTLYAVTPRNIANALAGLPFMGWRQSIRITRNLCSRIGGYQYFTVETIKRLISLSRSSQGNIAAVRFWVRALRPSGSNIVAELRQDQNVVFLSQAFVNANGSKCTETDLPYLIAREYLRLKQHPTPRDLLVKEVLEIRLESTALQPEKL